MNDELKSKSLYEDRYCPCQGNAWPVTNAQYLQRKEDQKIIKWSGSLIKKKKEAVEGKEEKWHSKEP